MLKKFFVVAVLAIAVFGFFPTFNQALAADWFDAFQSRWNQQDAIDDAHFAQEQRDLEQRQAAEYDSNVTIHTNRNGEVTGYEVENPSYSDQIMINIGAGPGTPGWAVTH